MSLSSSANRSLGRTGIRSALATALLFTFWFPAAAAAQDREGEPESPTIQSLLTGYGAVSYGAPLDDDAPSDFGAQISLVPLFVVEEDLLVAGEVELALHHGETLTALEHAEVHYLGFERVQLRAGKFHLPVGIWHHANWVNRMPSPPLLYEDAHGEAVTTALLPILFDLGAAAQWNVPLLDGWQTVADVWVTQGPRVPEGAGHAHGDEEEEPHAEPASDAPYLAYGSNFEDNNTNKLVGARVRAMGHGLTLQASGFRAAYDDAGELGVSALNLALGFSPGPMTEPLFDLKAEVLFLRQEYLHHEHVEQVDYGGYYAQLSRRFGELEPIARWSYLPEAIAGHGVHVERRRQLAVGLNYWLSASVPLKAAYHYEADGRDGLFFELAVGF